MHHIVYLTRNMINNNFYVGKHSTYNLDDGYLGSGLKLQSAIRKYGKDNFKRTTLCTCLTAEDAHNMERIIVNESFVSRKDTYNIALGGHGGNTFFGMSTTQQKLFSQKCRMNNLGKTFTEEHRSNLSQNHANVCGHLNPRSKHYVLIDPNKIEHHIIGNLTKSLKAFKFSQSRFYQYLNAGVIAITPLKNHSIKTRCNNERLNGWEFRSFH